ncbi:hypothetical protein HHK36_008602 [Tetracentron sinense]|uniref:Uncharacterized protein n=1 Tax=Tetracentron sinense TaxID=13715 RepID=A0A835DK48_TETSI|nr:hypothetical protein HHK36_008602 [Tetracentron sinense]
MNHFSDELRIPDNLPPPAFYRTRDIPLSDHPLRRNHLLRQVSSPPTSHPSPISLCRFSFRILLRSSSPTAPPLLFMLFRSELYLVSSRLFRPNRVRRIPHLFSEEQQQIVCSSQIMAAPAI